MVDDTYECTAAASRRRAWARDTFDSVRTTTARLGAAAGSAAVLFAGPVCIASAAPSPDPIKCAFTLSTPHIVVVSGATMVAATLTPAQCTGSAVTNSSTVCLKLVGDDAAPQCASASAQATALVHQPYRPGTTYTATGTGCSSLALGPSICQPASPTSAKL